MQIMTHKLPFNFILWYNPKIYSYPFHCKSKAFTYTKTVISEIASENGQTSVGP